MLFPKFQSLHTLKESLLVCQHCLYTEMRLDGTFNEITLSYIEPYRKK